MDEEMRLLEKAACVPTPVDTDRFNPNVVLPYGLTTEHTRLAMSDFVNFLGFINAELNSKGIDRLESMLMQANFSSMVGEFMNATIPKYCPTLVKNQYHNGHPDLIPAGRFPNNATRHGDEGIEVKGSRRPSGWQGHNPEDVWLMVFMFDSNTPVDAGKGVPPRPFRFTRVVGARIAKEDWRFDGRAEGSRRTITSTVLRTGYDKMVANWIYEGATPPRRRGRAAEPLLR